MQLPPGARVGLGGGELTSPSSQNYCGVNPGLERHTKTDERSPSDSDFERAEPF